MKKTAKRFLSMLLALSLVFGLLVFPAAATETEEAAETVETAEAPAEETAKKADVTVSDNFITLKLNTDGVEVDEESPVIITVEDELQNMMVLNADGELVPLTEDEKTEILKLFQMYLEHWEDNANLLGVQTPFFLSYNDSEDGLGILGEMLVLSGISVDAVRAGYVTFDDLQGMILNFYYGDKLGIEYYGDAIVAARKEVLGLIEESGAKTEAQKLLILNDWMAHINTFDMPYIMNQDKDTNGDGVIDENDDTSDPMVAETPVKNEHYDEVLETMTEVYEDILTDTFEGKIVDGLKGQVKQSYYPEAIQAVLTQVYTEGAVTEAAKDEKVVAAVKEAYWNEVYEAKKEELADSDVYWDAYNERYNRHLDDNCEHEFEAKFTWTETSEGVWAATADVTCTVCGRTHENVEATTETKTVAATCTAGSQTVCVATVTIEGYDSLSETKILSADNGDATGHTEVVDEAVEATCTETGLTEGKHCSVCGAVLVAQETVEAKDHSYDDNGVCTECGAVSDAHVHADADEDGDCDTCKGAMPTDEDDNSEGDESEGGESGSITDGEDAQTVNATITEEAEILAKQAGEDAVDEAAEDAADKALEALTDEEIQERAKAMIKADEAAMADIDAAVAEQVDDYMTENADAIAEDPVAFVDGEELFQTEVPVTDDDGNYILGEDGNPVMMTLAAQIHAGWDSFWADCEENGIPGMVAQFKLSAYQEAIKSAVSQGAVQQGMSEEDADAYAESYVEEHAEAIAEDPYAFCVENFGQDAADQMESEINSQLGQMGIDTSTETNPEGRVSLDLIVALQMETPMDDLGGMTPNEAIPVYAAQAASGLTDGIINYWEGSQFGALGFGTSVCLGYTKAYTYLVQYMHPEIYGVNGESTDMSVSANWKTADELYYDENGELDIYAGYIVDAVRITYDAEVTMYGKTEDNFNSDHFWNAVCIDGQWYYADPCYTDVFTEVMSRDRVETDGDMNHLYFLFSDTSARELYDGNFDAENGIKTLYKDAATNTDYEDSWISRIKSNTYFKDGYAYYIYDSTDMITLMEEYEEDNQSEIDFSAIIKLVRHQLTDNDKKDGDSDYETLIVFNYEDDDGNVTARLWDKDAQEAVDNELLTELYAKHAAYEEIYPSLSITAALYGDKVYFNLANCILSIDINTYELAVVKEYNTVYGYRDPTNPFGGMGFSVVDSADQATFTVENHPIAGLTIKEDGKMYVSIATNFAFISGKADRTNPASDGYGYAYEESNYNPDYSSYMDIEDSGYDEDELKEMGYEQEVNDNDEFMWTANFVETLDIAHFAGTSHTYEEVTVAPFCGEDGYTENRCTTCGAIEADTRVVDEGTACEHHYIEFHETYYTKDDGDAWNKGVSYVCTMCGFAIEEPTEPTENQYTDYEEDMAEYEKEKAIWDEAVANNGHTYAPTDAEWAEDYSTVTFSVLECTNVCPERKPYIDVLLEDDTITLELDEAVTAEAERLDDKDGYAVFQATGEVEIDGETYKYTATKLVPLEPSNVTRISGKDRYKTAYAVANELKEILGVETFDTIIVAYGVNFPDALAGSYLSTELEAPILLTDTKVDSDVQAYIEENLTEGGKVYILGGTAAVSQNFQDGLEEAGIEVERLSGKTRYDTNLAILKAAGLNGKEILVCTGTNYADSLSASASNLPILLVDGKASTLTTAQAEYLESLGDDYTFYIVGGTGAVCEDLETALAEYGKVERISGKTREATSVELAKTFFKDPDCAVLAYSRNFPDGLCGGLLAYKMNAPMLLVDAKYETYAEEYVAENGIEKGYVLGGSAAVSDEIVKTVFGLSEFELIN